MPLYVSEMAPQKHRGAFNIVFQLAITFGIFIANLVNYLTPKIRGLNDKEIGSEFQDLVTASEAAKQVEHPWTRILKRQ